MFALTTLLEEMLLNPQAVASVKRCWHNIVCTKEANIISSSPCGHVGPNPRHPVSQIPRKLGESAFENYLIYASVRIVEVTFERRKDQG
jgi:hypothetical protein